jgi:hypothetical protein
MEGRPHRLALKPFDKASGNDSYLRSPDGWSRREADIAGNALRHRNWADCARTVVASGRTGVSVIAVIPLRARKGLDRPKRKF